MRQTILASLVLSAQYNVNRKRTHLRFYEMGKVFFGLSPDVQHDKIALLATGNAPSIHAPPLDFFSFKADVVALLGQADFYADDYTFLHPHQAASVSQNGKRIGFMGKLHPSIAKKYDLGDVFVAEFDISALTHAPNTSVLGAPKTLPVSRDIAMIVDNVHTWDKILACILATDVARVDLFDVYPMGDKRSLAMTLTWQPNATLTNDEINARMNAVIDVLTTQFNAVLRDGK